MLQRIHKMKGLSLLVTALIMSSCATYYQNNYSFNSAFEKGHMPGALEALQKTSGDAQGRNRFIYFANKGLILSMLGQYAESNENFEKAFLFGEDYRLKYLTEAASYLTNPMVTTYRGEDHEHLMVLYYKALNYLKLGNPEAALVECRRLTIRLNQLSDRYTSESKFQRDAFIHTLMGIIYQSTHDYNNAFIAYRNAVEIYESDYAKFFNIETPEQLRFDLLNTAYWTGFYNEFDHYKEKFNKPNYKPTRDEAELVFLWHNGLSPVKTEWSINFVINNDGGNLIAFKNEELAFVFPFEVKEEKDRNNLTSLEFFRVAFPRYIERPAYYTSASLRIADSVSYSLQIAEDVNKIAFYSLKQRMVAELSKGLLRAALKKTAEHSMRKENEHMGALVGLVNAISEKADTRNWQTLPRSIHYARVPLKEGENHIQFDLESAKGKDRHDFTYAAKKGETLFHTFSSLESYPASYRYY